jgi:hypothetical protein
MSVSVCPVSTALFYANASIQKYSLLINYLCRVRNKNIDVHPHIVLSIYLPAGNVATAARSSAATASLEATPWRAMDLQLSYSLGYVCV